MAQEAIFIGYRRDDTADVAGRIYDAMAQRFGRDRVFKDVDNIGPGVDFGDYIKSVLPNCRVALVLIGPRWLESRDELGTRRLDDIEDWVRVEIETALATLDLLTVPVLVNGARMPRSEEVPESLKPLLRRNAAMIRRDPDFHDDVEKLAAAVRASVSTGTLDLSNVGGERERSLVPAAENRGAPIAPAYAHSAKEKWKSISNSLDSRDYEDFIQVFQASPEVFDARRQLRQLNDWAAIKKSDAAAIKSFRTTNLFEALSSATRSAQKAAEEEQARTERAAEAARARVEAELRTQRLAGARRSVELGEKNANVLLAKELLRGNRTERAEALQLLRDAAERGESEAQFDLGRLYATGKLGTLEKNPQIALDWLNKAAAQGHVAAEERAEKLTRREQAQRQYEAKETRLWPVEEHRPVEEDRRRTQSKLPLRAFVWVSVFILVVLALFGLARFLGLI